MFFYFYFFPSGVRLTTLTMTVKCRDLSMYTWGHPMNCMVSHVNVCKLERIPHISALVFYLNLKKNFNAYVCVLVKVTPSRGHLSLVAGCGKAPVEKAVAYFPAPHTGLFLSLLWHKLEENPFWCVCSRVCVYIYVCVCTPSHLVTSDAAVGSRSCQESPRLAGVPNADAHMLLTHT